MMLGCERPQTLLDEEELVQLVFPWKHGVAVDEFAEDAANRPHVDFLAVVGADKQLRRAIPASGDIVGEGLLGVFFLDASEPEIADLELSVIADQQVFRLDIPVNDIHRMQVGEPLHQLEDHRANLLVVEPVGRFLQHLQQVVPHVFKY